MPADAAEITPALAFEFGSMSTTVAALMGGTGRHAARTRQAIYQKWAQMESDPIVSTALMLLCTAALGGHETTGKIVFIEPSPEARGDKQAAAMVEDIDRHLGPMLNQCAFTMAYLAAAFGDAFVRVYSEDKAGVVGLYTDELVRPEIVQAYERGGRTAGFSIYTGMRNFEPLDITQMARVKMPRTQWVPQYGVMEKALRIAITEDDMSQLPLMPAAVGGSLLFNAELAYDNLAASLCGLVGQRWMDSIDERILTVNMESMTKDQQSRFIESVGAMLLRSKTIAEEAVTANHPVLERIRHILPVFNEKQVVQVNDAGATARTSTISVEDVMVHARMLSGALGVDLAMIGFADQLSGGLGEGGFFRTSAQAAERARIIRVALADGFNQIIDIHTLKKYGTVFPPESRPWTINFYGSISALEAEKGRTRLDAMNAGASLVQNLQGLRDLGADKKIMETFMSKVLMLDEDLASEFSRIADLKPDEGGAGGFGPAGGGPATAEMGADEPV